MCVAPTQLRPNKADAGIGATKPPYGGWATPIACMRIAQEGWQSG
jgi:hypothetical protein